jgi:zinc D-Ala-D-Ala carboxypeptidase
MSKRRRLIIFTTLLLVGFTAAVLLLRTEETQAPAVQQSVEPSLEPVEQPRYDFKSADSQYVLVNKRYPLPKGYVPADLVAPAVKLRLPADQEQMKIRKRVESSLISMFNAAKADGITLVFGSGYRSEKLQESFYTQYKNQSGQAAADTFSARPGHSEHQTGLAFDATTANGSCHLEVCFGDTPEGTWLAKNAYKYGFIIRYPEGKTTVTGYQYEPWHLRYVGAEVAAKIIEQNSTFEEFSGLGPAPQY